MVTEVIYYTRYLMSTMSSSSNNLFIVSREGNIFRTNKSTGDYTEISNVGYRINQLKMVPN